MESNTVSDNVAANLPPELLSSILKRLRLSDVKVCRMVCRSWGWSASRQMAEMSYFDYRGQLEGIESNDSSTSQEALTSPMSLVAIKSLRFRKICISFSNDLMASQWAMGPIMKELVSLKLYKCQVKEEDFLRILAHCLGEHQDNSTDEAKSHDNPGDKKKIESEYSRNA